MMPFKSSRPFFFLIPFLFVILYFRIFFTNYAYLDEIHQLWHNDDDSNFRMFLTQGRWLTGVVFQKLFSSVASIEQLKLFRIASLAGWIATTLVWSAIFKRWVQILNMTPQIWWVGCIYFACSISVCIFIGWASCMQIFLATLAALLSSDLVFKNLYRNQATGLSASVIIMSLALGIVSLFTYQSAFGIFLLPFFLHYLQSRKSRPGRILVIGIIFYLFTYILYYLLFKYSLRAFHLAPADRTIIQFNPIKKISFFFSGPFPQAFSVNLLFLARSVLSQVFYSFVFVVWLVLSLGRNTGARIGGKLVTTGIIFCLLALIYLPGMVAAENFASYRTLFAFNLAVFLMLVETIYASLKQEGVKRFFTAFMIAWLLITGYYTFNFQFIIPLTKEYKVLKNFFATNYNSRIKTVYFIRPDKFLFNSEFGTNVYRDEFGAPSTYRDWVPEPITKQLVFELTNNRRTAETISVVQFADAALFKKSNLLVRDSTLLIDMNELFRSQDHHLR